MNRLFPVSDVSCYRSSQVARFWLLVNELRKGKDAAAERLCSTFCGMAKLPPICIAAVPRTRGRCPKESSTEWTPPRANGHEGLPRSAAIWVEGRLCALSCHTAVARCKFAPYHSPKPLRRRSWPVSRRCACLLAEAHDARRRLLCKA